MIAYLVGAVVLMRLFTHGTQAAVCEPAREREIISKVSRRMAMTMGFSGVALAIAFTARDLTEGTATAGYLLGLFVALPLVLSFGVYLVSSRFSLPFRIWGLRMAARGALPVGWYEVACGNCGASSENLRAEAAALNSRITWRCRKCGNVNVLEPASVTCDHA